MTRRVVVVGGGNAALCAALSARERGAQVTLLERAPFDLRGGNTRFTAGAMRAVYHGVDDLVRLMPDLTASEIERTDFSSYSAENFFDDLGRVTQYRCDPALAEPLVNDSFDTLRWMQSHGVRFLPLYGRQSFNVDGRVRFWGGLTIEAWGGGPGLIDSLTAAAERSGVVLHYGARAIGLTMQSGRVAGVRIQRGGREEAIGADAVILAAGGFEANPAWRARYLGPGWDLARVRGTRFNTGDGIRMALDVGAAARGHWSGCHAVGWDANAPEFGDLAVGDGFQKHSYPFGIMVNARGQRFVDEGADFRNYTYAKYGREILLQPEQDRLANLRRQGHVTAARRIPHSPSVARGTADTRRCAVATMTASTRPNCPPPFAAFQCRPSTRRRRSPPPPARMAVPRVDSRFPNRTGPIRWTRRHSKPTR